ncbi:Transthyretin-like family-containing protein [Strongyloides ratti]|uniref:Transthyretin-like family-containing protein n=1 Tax=Strongyloides ratti TaxID=34506 RepID=A0A090LQP4_STRRB|nr:Transthyretin-like family-containing protein [Strongyloides ratti]CEF70501.1 Transthyretin-like family-containing protein [Strongyloides ratti]
MSFGITYITIAILISSTLVESIGRTQAAGAKGYLTCNGKPATDVKIKMYDDDSGIDLDDFMAETTTDSKGYFSLSGTKSELLTIDAKINIYHNCNDNVLQKLCYRKFTIWIPDNYINSGSTATNFYDIGRIELAGKISGESRDCIN